MSLLQALVYLINLWRPAFCKEEAFARAKEHAIGGLCAFGRRTVTNLAIFLGRDKTVPSSDYKLYSSRKWKPQDLFDPLFAEALKHVPGRYIVVAADDTKIRKTGKKILQCRWGADPMGPPFQTNLIWSLRFLQFACVIPLYLYTSEFKNRKRERQSA